jgi:hypothetical protein
MRMLDSRLISERRGHLSGVRMGRLFWLLAGAALLAAVLVGSATHSITGAAKEGDQQVSGAGKTIIEGGGPGLVPVTTVLAFHASGQGGDFECLALMPPVATSFTPESGDFEVNAMYVTGKVNSVTVRDGTAVLHGTATVTGIGAGANLPFTFVAQAGGPGTTATLTVSGLTFHEILLEGQITIH